MGALKGAKTCCQCGDIHLGFLGSCCSSSCKRDRDEKMRNIRKLMEYKRMQHNFIDKGQLNDK